MWTLGFEFIYFETMIMLTLNCSTIYILLNAFDLISEKNF